MNETDTEELVDDLIDQAWEESDLKLRAKFSRRALALDPDAIDAYVALAFCVDTLAERISLLREATRIGRSMWTDELRRPPKHFFWSDISTRPFMRATHNLSLALWERKEREEAAALADQLIRINPNDNQGMRYMALAWHPILENWPRVEQILEQYEGEISTYYLYAKCLNAFRCRQDAEASLKQAAETNPHVPRLLLAAKPRKLSSDITATAYRSKEEAMAYAEHNRDSWKAVPLALDWLRKATKEHALK